MYYKSSKLEYNVLTDYLYSYTVSSAKHIVPFRMSDMIDHVALMLSPSYTLCSIQILSPIIYHQGLYEAGSPCVFLFSLVYIGG